jgi:hypothetical protein
MDSDPFNPKISDDAQLHPSLLEALRTLPSEQGGPSAETDAAVLAAAREVLKPLRQRRIIHRLWPVLAAAACAVFAFLLFFGPQKTSETYAQSHADEKYALILRELTTLFPQQIKSIVSDGDDLQIALSDEPLTDSGQAVVIEVCARGNCKAVITYVGQTIEIDNHRITVRTDENGTIVTDSSDDDLRIKTRRI